MLSKRLHCGPGSQELSDLLAPALKVYPFLKKTEINVDNVTFSGIPYRGGRLTGQ